MSIARFCQFTTHSTLCDNITFAVLKFTLFHSGYVGIFNVVINMVINMCAKIVEIVSVAICGGFSHIIYSFD